MTKLNSLELEIIQIIGHQQWIQKEEIVTRLASRLHTSNYKRLGYRAFKMTLESLEHQSLISRQANGHFYLTAFGKQQLQQLELGV